MPGFPEVSGDLSAGGLSVALICPDEQRRKVVAGVLAECPEMLVREFSSYPVDVDKLPQMLEKHYDAVIIDLDSDQECAYQVVKNICAHSAIMVLVCSVHTNFDLAIRFMRAGAREFLVLPLTAAEMANALSRARVRLPEASPVKKTAGKSFVFLGAKGGCGVTTLASNFAVLLTQQSGQKTLLIDLGLPLGDAAINLGIVADFSTEHAFQNVARMDLSFLSTLLTKHSSGLSVLAAPGELRGGEITVDGVNKLIAIVRDNFDYVVVDAGSRLDLMGSALFDDFANIFFVTQVGVSELRNANRMISRYFANRGNSLQIVLNRYVPQALLFGEEHITKALTRPAEWRIPDDYASARRTRHTASPLALEDSRISMAIREMARNACGSPEIEEKKKGFRLFRRSL